MSEQNLTSLTREHLDRVIGLVNNGDHNNAIKFINTLIDKFPENPLLYNFQGVCYEAGKRLDLSIISFKRAVLLNPKYSEAFYNLGVTQNKLGKKNDSIESYKKAIAIKPHYPAAQNNLGLALSLTGKLDEAIIHLKLAVDLNPSFAEAFNNLGLTYIELNDNINAIKSFKKATHINPNFSRPLINLGHLYQEIGQFNLSLKSYEKLLDINPNSGEAQVFIGILHRHNGQMKKAVKSFEKALKINPKLINAYYELANDSNYKISSKQLSTLLRLKKNNELSQNNKINLNFTLAKISEKNNENDKFIEFLLEGNKLRKQQINYSIFEDENRFRIYRDIFNSSKLKVLKKNIKTPKTKQPIFIVGMPRSGSTLVEQILSSHKRVYGAGETEIFRKILNDKHLNFDNESVKKIRKKYLNIIEQSNFSENIFTDKSLLNFQFIGLIINVFPEAKIIHLKRDSKAICWSNFKTNFSQKNLGFSNNLDDLSKYYRLYENQMVFWHKEYPNTIYDLNYENLTFDQASETGQLLEYCGLEWDENCLHFYNNKRLVKTASKDQVRKNIYSGSSDAWKKYKKYLGPLNKDFEDI